MAFFKSLVPQFRLLALACISAFASLAFAGGQAAGYTPHANQKLYFQELTLSNNQSIKYLNAIAEDHSGYIWMGTFDMLLRFNGHDFKSFNHKIGDSSSIAHSSITSLCVVNDTLMLVGTEISLSLLNLKNHLFINLFEADGKLLKTPSAYFVNGSHVLVGAYNGLFDLDIAKVRVKAIHLDLYKTNLKRSPSSFWVRAIAKHPFRPHSVLLGTEAGLVLFDLNTKTVIRQFINQELESKSYTLPSIHSIVVDHDIAWTYSWVSGLNKLDLHTGNWTNYFLDGKTNLDSFVALNGDEFLLDISGTIGLRVFNKKKGTLSGDITAMMAGSMHTNGDDGCFFWQSNGVLWMSNVEGVSRQVPNYRTFKKIDYPKKYLWAWPLMELPELGKYYFRFTLGGNSCSYTQAENKWHTLKSPVKTSYPFEVINAVPGPGKKLLLTTFNQGVCELDPATDVTNAYTLKNGSRIGPDLDNPFRTPFYDSKKQLWLGTYTDGLYRVSANRDTLVHFALDKWKPSRIISFAEDSYSRIWIASTAGMLLYDPTQGVFSDAINEAMRKKGIVPDRVYSIKRDTLGRMWMTMPFTGLLRIDLVGRNGFKIKLFQREQGLNNLNCNFMAMDRNGGFWIMDNGLLYFNPYNETYHFIDEWNGLLTREGGDSRILVDSKGSVWVGEEFMPDLMQSIESATVSPIKHLAIDQLVVNGVPFRGSLNDNPTIRLSHQENNLTFFFSDICYDNPELIQYRYRIKGLEKDWNLTNTLSEAHYNNLPPGKYTFVVNAGYRGQWLGSEAGVSFRINQPFWKSLWFITCLSCFLAFILWLAITIRFRSKLNAIQIRNTIASDLHDEINSTLSSISIMSDVLQNNDKLDFLKQGLNEINKNAKNLLNKMDDIIWLINPAKDNFEDFELRLNEFMIPLFESKDIDYIVHFPQGIGRMRMPVEVRKNLFLILKEAINNLVKYSDCTRAEILIEYHSPEITAIVRDNGIGFDTTHHTQRNGIRNMKSRALQIKGLLLIHPASPHGTEIILKVNV